MNALDAARRYLARGWQPIPLSPHSKRPALAGWQALRLTEDVLGQHFDGRGNIGLLLGTPSGGLVDVDLDSPEAAALADGLLPSTPAVFGRASKPRSHRLYVAAPPPATARFQAPDGSTLVEHRSDGSQTAAPPSTHPSGEPVRWEPGAGPPATVEPGLLIAGVRRLAAAALLVRTYPAPGARHDLGLAFAGALLRAGWGEDEAGDFIAAVARAAGDEEAEDRVAAVRTTARRLQSNGRATGLPSLAKLVGEDAAGRVSDWLGLGRESAPDNGQQAASPKVPTLNSRDSGTDRSAAIVQVWQQPEPAPRRWLLPGLLPEGCLSIFYGDAGVFKSWLATALAVSLAAGRPFLGYDLSASIVLYLDSELDAEEFTRRAYQVARGLGLQRPPVGLHYLRLPGTLANLGVASTVAESVQSVGPRLTILDSLSLAAFGSDLSGADAATLVLHMVKRWGTVLALDHCPKPMPGVEMSSYRPYGSQFKYAEGRSIVQVLRAESGRGALLRPVKSNFGPLGEPVGASVTFLPDRVEVARADLGSLAMAGAEKHLPARDRLLLALDAAGEGGATLDELAEETTLAVKTVKNTLTSLLATSRAERLGDGRWRSVSRQPNSPGVPTVKGRDFGTGRPPAIEAPDPETPTASTALAGPTAPSTPGRPRPGGCNHRG